jgi:hypothetical protein
MALTIYPVQQVREAVATALLERPGDTDAAIETAALRLALPIEAVRDTVHEQEADHA